MRCCKLIILVFSMLLMACSSSPSKYNGFKGYKINNKDQQSVSLTYIDESKKDNNDVVVNAKKSCAYLLDGSQLSDVKFDMMDKKIYKKDIFFNLSLPSFNNSGDGRVTKDFSSGTIPKYYTDKVVKRISFIEVSLTCRKLVK
jgi:hypothetical protein